MLPLHVFYLFTRLFLSSLSSLLLPPKPVMRNSLSKDANTSSLIRAVPILITTYKVRITTPHFHYVLLFVLIPHFLHFFLFFFYANLLCSKFFCIAVYCSSFCFFCAFFSPPPPSSFFSLLRHKCYFLNCSFLL